MITYFPRNFKVQDYVDITLKSTRYFNQTACVTLTLIKRLHVIWGYGRVWEFRIPPKSRWVAWNPACRLSRNVEWLKIAELRTILLQYKLYCKFAWDVPSRLVSVISSRAFGRILALVDMQIGRRPDLELNRATVTAAFVSHQSSRHPEQLHILIVCPRWKLPVEPIGYMLVAYI